MSYFNLVVPFISSVFTLILWVSFMPPSLLHTTLLWQLILHAYTSLNFGPILCSSAHTLKSTHLIPVMCSLCHISVSILGGFSYLEHRITLHLTIFTRSFLHSNTLHVSSKHLYGISSESDSCTVSSGNNSLFHILLHSLPQVPIFLRNTCLYLSDNSFHFDIGCWSFDMHSNGDLPKPGAMF